MAPREDGSFLVPAPIIKLWRDTVDGGRDEVKKLWQNCGADKELMNMGNQHCVFKKHLNWCPATSKSQPPFSRLHQEAFVKTCKKRTESIQEQDLWVDGAFMSEKDMVDDGYDASSGKPINIVFSVLEKITGFFCRLWFGAYMPQVLSAVAGFKVQNSGYQNGVQAKHWMDQVPSLHPSPASCTHLTLFVVCIPIRRPEARPVSAKRLCLLGGGPDQGSPVDVCLH